MKSVLSPSFTFFAALALALSFARQSIICFFFSSSVALRALFSFRVIFSSRFCLKSVNFSERLEQGLSLLLTEKRNVRHQEHGAGRGVAKLGGHRQSAGLHGRRQRVVAQKNGGGRRVRRMLLLCRIRTDHGPELWRIWRRRRVARQVQKVLGVVWVHGER